MIRRRPAGPTAAWCALLLALALAPVSCAADDADSAAAAPTSAKRISTEEAAMDPTAADPLPKAEPTGEVHPCAGAGRWFPGSADALKKAVDGYLDVETPPIDKPPVALIAPHAGYQFSGAVAGKGYAALKGRSYDRVILIGLSHQRPLSGASVRKVDAYETPLGKVPVDLAACQWLLECPVVKEQPACHATEWSCENQLPFLQRALGSFEMVELLVGALRPDERKVLAKAVHRLVDEKTLLVASSDFTHFGPNYGYVPFMKDVRQNLERLNAVAVQRICQIDLAGFDDHLARTKDTICGRHGIGLLLAVVAAYDDVRASLVARAMSGQLTGDWANSVTYDSIVFWRAGEGLSKDEQKTLLRLARDSVTHYLRFKQELKPEAKMYDLTPALRARGAAFVTLKNAGRLRGCIGHIQAVEPLYESVIGNACNACEDRRFRDNPITEDEVKDLTVEISVLSPMRRVGGLDEIVIGRDGLIMARGRQQGVFLPQVPVEQGWDRGQYLVHLCGKAGLPPDAWQDPQTQLYRFTAQVFHADK